MKLTAEGKRWVQENQETSIIARVALLADSGQAQTWPQGFQQTATRIANEAGRKD